MKGHGSKFGHKKEAAIAALLSQRSTEDAARYVGVAVNTLLRWMKETEFKTAWLEARRVAFSQTIARLQQSTGAAASTLLKVMVDPSTPAATKVRAANSVLELSIRAIEIEEIEVRLGRLEQGAEAAKKVDEV